MGLVVGTLSIPFIRGEAVHGWGAGLSQARKTIKSCRYPRLAWGLDGLCEPGAPRSLPISAAAIDRVEAFGCTHGFFGFLTELLTRLAGWLLT
jgi:hypothetical protein